MAKQYKVKDINNNGKIDGWEQGKYDAINKSATKMGYSMKMGSKQIDTPTNFNTKDVNLIAQAPMMMHKEGHDPKKDKKSSQISSFSHPDFTQEKSVKEYKSKGLSGIKTVFGTLGDTRVTGKLKSKVLKK